MTIKKIMGVGGKSYKPFEDCLEVNIAELNARIARIVAHENELRVQIDEIIKTL